MIQIEYISRNKQSVEIYKKYLWKLWIFMLFYYLETIYCLYCPDDKTAVSVFYEKRRKNKREITLIIN